MKEKLKKFFKERKLLFSWRRIWVTVVAIVVFFGIFFTGLIAYASAYNNKVLPGVHLGEIDIGGMNREQLKSFLQNMTDKLVSEGLEFNFTVQDEKKSFFISPIIVSEDSSVELIHFDTDEELGAMLGYGKSGDIITRAFNIISARINQPKISLQNFDVDKEKILEIIKKEVEPYESEGRNANVLIKSIIPLDYEIASSSVGTSFQSEAVLGQVTANLAVLRVSPIELSQVKTEPTILEADVESVEVRLPAVFSAGALQLKYTDPHTKRERFWSISLEKIKDWIEVQKTDEGELGFGLNKESVLDYLKTNVSPLVDVDAQDAKFEINETTGKVMEFQGSRPGIGLDKEEAYKLINDAILQRPWHDEGITKSIQLAVEQTEPNTKTGEVNELGISELLGVGVSDYSNSPSNRIKNIRNAVNKLNGVLIKPDEEFSTIKYTSPYTIEGGYLPELVIKGNEIKPEIGGGLCQIGTTLFRMAMNSAMLITERRNHSLVVFHYDDPVNGLPGTDATVYEPRPDFKFKNDTGNYILLQTYMDTANEELVFSLWGTSDGRQGSYTHPVVLNWIGYGEPQMIETTDLDPGQKNCQKPFSGANTTFTYTRELADGTKEERVFESHYRSLPQICLVGVAEKTEGCVEGDVECLESVEEDKEEVLEEGVSVEEVKDL